MMRYYRVHQFFISVLLSIIFIGAGICPAIGYQDNPYDIEETDITEEMDVLDTGPMHEAYAEPSTSDTDPGIVVSKPPPDPIDEVPPEQEGLDEDAEWISGYWAWDDERNDFIWISGTWRVPPLGRHWVAGYWTEAGQGHQWVSGYWADNNVAENEYYPEPPESLDEGPNAEAPSQDHVWIPGCWIWTHHYYAWRPGYWAALRPDRIWVPAHYVWTPRGYIFAGGYWDYPIARRGVLFAPVYFYPRFFTRVFFPFTPRIVISVNVFSNHLFFRPRYRHYYFGNYYAAKYSRKGIYHVSSMHRSKHRHDPIYAHQRYTHRSVPERRKGGYAGYDKQQSRKNKQPKKNVKKKKYQHKKAVQYNRNSSPYKHKGKNKNKPPHVKKIKKNRGQKTVFKKNDMPGHKKKSKKYDGNTQANAKRRVARKPKAVANNNPVEKPLTKKAARNYNKDQSPRKEYRDPRGNPEKDVVPEISNNPNFNGRGKQQEYNSEDRHTYNRRRARDFGQDREGERPDLERRGNQRVTKWNKNKTNNQRKYEGRSSRNSDNRQRRFNRRR